MPQGASFRHLQRTRADLSPNAGVQRAFLLLLSPGGANPQGRTTLLLCTPQAWLPPTTLVPTSGSRSSQTCSRSRWRRPSCSRLSRRSGATMGPTSSSRERCVPLGAGSRVGKGADGVRSSTATSIAPCGLLHRPPLSPPNRCSLLSDPRYAPPFFSQHPADSPTQIAPTSPSASASCSPRASKSALPSLPLPPSNPPHRSTPPRTLST